MLSSSQLRRRWYLQVRDLSLICFKVLIKPDQGYYGVVQIVIEYHLNSNHLLIDEIRAWSDFTEFGNNVADRLYIANLPSLSG